jgi:hypothetical protein
MFTLFNHFVQVTEGRRLARKRVCIKILVLIGLGIMVLMVIALLSGCGSDSTPGGSVKEKNAKAAAGSKATKMPAVISLLTDKEGTDPGKMGNVKKQPDAQRLEAFPGMTVEELEARDAADRKKFEDPNNEIFPGITRKELEARVAADRKKFEDPNHEIFPGITRKELEARDAADRKKFEDPNHEIFPGITMAELNARRAAEPKPDRRLMMETFPGLNHK